jgi:hypothetical protein
MTVCDPETPDRTMRTAKADAFKAPVMQLSALIVIAFILGTAQLPVVLVLTHSQLIYVVAIGFIAAAIAVAWVFGLWRASWFVRVAAALICVAVPSWPVVGMFLFAVCYFGPCRFW